jgi:tetratricopeptide (TPR) repeat protein
VSSNPERSRLAQVGRLSRQAEAAASAGRVAEAVALLKEVLRLDPRNRRVLHRLGDLHRVKLARPREAARYYAARARLEEAEGSDGKAIAVWKLAARWDPSMREACERIGALYVGMGLVADARRHYEKSALELAAGGLAGEAAILRAHLAALEDPSAPRAVEAPARESAEPGPVPSKDEAPDDTAAAFAADRLQNARVFHHFGLHGQARQQLEELLASLPEHPEARQLLVEVCRALGDEDAAARHLRLAMYVLRRRGEAEAPATEEAEELPPVEEWAAEEPEDPLASLIDDIREDVERLVDRLGGKGGGR